MQPAYPHVPQLVADILASHYSCPSLILFFFFNDPATTEIYTLSLHDALPIFGRAVFWPTRPNSQREPGAQRIGLWGRVAEDRKSTRLNSSHSQISYAVFCLKKKKKITTMNLTVVRIRIKRTRKKEVTTNKTRR